MSSLSINSNLNALPQQRRTKGSSNSRGDRLEKLASELKIDGQDEMASDLSISRGLASRLQGGAQTLKSLQDGISMLQTADGGTERIQDNLRSIRELSVQASNSDAATESDREEFQQEVNQLTDEINEISRETEFNGQQLLNGDISNGTQLVADPDQEQTVNLSVTDLSAESLGIDDVDVSSPEAADDALDSVNTALNQVATERADIGATVQQLESSVDSSLIQRENQQAADSEIRDAALARQATEEAGDTLRSQADTSTFAQANGLQGSSALNLLQ